MSASWVPFFKYISWSIITHTKSVLCAVVYISYLLVTPSEQLGLSVDEIENHLSKEAIGPSEPA